MACRRRRKAVPLPLPREVNPDLPETVERVILKAMAKAPDQLHKVLQVLRTMPFVHVRRQMGDNAEFNPVCNLYVCVADPKNYRLAYQWAMTMGDGDE